MGCPTEVELNQYVTFSITTHDPDTGVLTDADAAPAYRIYEDETATPILTGTMAKLDDANTTGFYTERVQASTVNGFELTKTYTVYVEATVDGDTGGIAYGFIVTAEGVGAGSIEFTYTLTKEGTETPIADVSVWVTTDSAGANVIASGRTDQNGQVVFQLEAGTLYFWRQKSGWNFTNPDTEEIT